MNCKTKRCINQAKTGNFCHKCVKRKFKENNPERYAYDTLKNNAKRRGKEFTITFEYFKRFAKRTSYIAGKGIEKESLHIDRKKEYLGYVPGNLQVLTNSENIKKYLRYDHGQGGKPINFKVKKSVDYNEKNAPF